MAIRAIALDLDGTLVKTGVLEISAADRAAVRAAADAGVQVIIATARTPAQARQFQIELGLTGPLIGNTGAVIELDDRTKLLHRRIDPECSRRIVSALMAADLYPNVIQGDEIIRRRRSDETIGRETTHVAFLEYTAELVDDLLPAVTRGATQIGVFAGSLDRVLDAIAAEPVCTLRFYDGELLSGAVFIHASASKGDALRTLLAYMGVRASDVLAIGDSDADLPMFEIAGHSVAVANATAPVRAAAEWVAPSQWDGGVAAAIRRFVLPA